MLFKDQPEKNEDPLGKAAPAVASAVPAAPAGCGADLICTRSCPVEVDLPRLRPTGVSEVPAPVSRSLFATPGAVGK